MKMFIKSLACAVAMSCGVALAQPHGGGGGGHFSGGGAHFSGGAHYGGHVGGGHISSGHVGHYGGYGGGHYGHGGHYYGGGYGGYGGVYLGDGGVDYGVPYGGYYDAGPDYYGDSGPAYDVSPAVPAQGDNTVVAVQSALQQQGYYKDSVDGEMGPNTQAAISSYQSSHGLVVTGAINAPLLRSLGIQ